MQKLSALEAFVAVVERGSFTGAARALDASKSRVSKEIARLEESLGAHLLQRSTRQVRPTDTGLVYYERVRAALSDLEAAAGQVRARAEEPRGLLRVSVPVSFGERYLVGEILAFAREHAELSIDLHCSDERVRLIEDGFDLAVRIGALPDSGLRARRLARTRSLLVASPGYLARRGVPADPGALRAHDCLRYAYQVSGASWRLVGPGEREELVGVDGQVCANNGDALLAAARSDFGVALLPDFFVAEDLQSERLERVLPAWSGGESGIWAVYAHARYVPPKVRVLVDRLAEALGGASWGGEGPVAF